MMVKHALRGLSLSVLLLAPAVLTQDDTVVDCDSDCRLEQELGRIEKQLKWLADKWDQLYPEDASDDPFPDEPFPWETTSSTSEPSSSPVYISQTFGTPSHTGTPLPWYLQNFTPGSAFVPTSTPTKFPSSKYKTRSSSAIPSFSGLSSSVSYSSNPSSTSLQPIPASTMGGGDGYKAVAYYTDWSIYARQYDLSTMLPADKLTHVLYSFADNRDNGEVFLTDSWSDKDKHWPGDSWNDVGNNLYGGLKQMNLLKKKNRNLKMLLSIGGWTYTNVAKHLDGPASNPQGRQAFANSCVQMIKDYGFDGIDIDWEYPQNSDQGNQLLLLLQAIRQAMDAYANTLAANSTYGGQEPHFILTIAAPAGETNYRNIPLAKVAQTLDFINLMGYDFAGSWDNCSGHQANLYPSQSNPASTPFSVHKVVQDYVNNGVPSQKIVLGMPLYGRAFMNTTGLGQPFHGIGEPNQALGSWEAGVWDFKSLPRPGATEHYDKEAGATFSYDAATGMLVSYDTVDMAKRKTDYIRKNDLGGAMWWELSGDGKNASSIILNAVNDLGGADGGKLEHRPNWLNYPDSPFDNVRAGFPNS